MNIREMTIIESIYLTIQYRYPRSKKRRIQKKWSKRPENYKPRPDVIVDQQRRVIYAHPATARKLRNLL